MEGFLFCKPTSVLFLTDMSSKSTDPAIAIYRTGYSLLGIFLAINLFNFLPLKIGDPGWLQKVTENFQYLGIIALVGALLISSSRLFSNFDNLDSRYIVERIRLVRKICKFAFIGWLLLIPLQTWSGFKVIRQIQSNERMETKKLYNLRNQFKSLTTEQDLRNLINQQPGTPPIPDKLPISFENFQKKFVQRIDEQIKRIETLAEENNSARMQRWIADLAKQVIINIFLATGFRSIGQTRNNNRIFKASNSDQSIEDLDLQI
jgi:hypothetical protein